MKKLFLLSGFIMFLSFSAEASSIPTDLTSAFNNGDASGISRYINNTIELTLFEKEEIYSKTQAEIILRSFFSKNPPTEFVLLHEGGKESSRYAIGSLKTDRSAFRITFLLKSIDSKVFIHQLRIEKGNE